MPSVATRARSAATVSAGAPVKSCMTCQRIDGSESSSQSITWLSRFFFIESGKILSTGGLWQVGELGAGIPQLARSLHVACVRGERYRLAGGEILARDAFHCR